MHAGHVSQTKYQYWYYYPRNEERSLLCCGQHLVLRGICWFKPNEIFLLPKWRMFIFFNLLSSDLLPCWFCKSLKSQLMLSRSLLSKRDLHGTLSGKKRIVASFFYLIKWDFLPWFATIQSSILVNCNWRCFYLSATKRPRVQPSRAFDLVQQRTEYALALNGIQRVGREGTGVGRGKRPRIRTFGDMKFEFIGCLDGCVRLRLRVFAFQRKILMIILIRWTTTNLDHSTCTNSMLQMAAGFFFVRSNGAWWWMDGCLAGEHRTGGMPHVISPS